MDTLEKKIGGLMAQPTLASFATITEGDSVPEDPHILPIDAGHGYWILCRDRSHNDGMAAGRCSAQHPGRE